MRFPLPKSLLGCVLALVAAVPAYAQFGVPFMGGIPGRAQSNAIALQLHQARTLLYREALDELRKNPTAADIKECSQGRPRPGEEMCISQPSPAAAAPTPQPPAAAVAQPPVAPAVPKPPVVEAAPPSPAAPTVPPAAEAPKPVVPPVAEAPSKPAPAAVAPPRKLAVLIGINSYVDPIPTLNTPLSDVQAIGDVLSGRFGYEVRYAKNATKGEIARVLNELAADARETDSVLVMYAGHGYLMDETKMGYWIPADASVKTAANWISNNDIAKFLKAIQANQMILVSDSCFSGTLTREQRVTARASAGPTQRSVLALSSGGEEPVSDDGKDGHSIFAYHLLQLLRASSRTTPGYDVFRTVKDKVMKDYPQEPQYGAVISAGHREGGEYFFQPR